MFPQSFFAPSYFPQRYYERNGVNGASLPAPAGYPSGRRRKRRKPLEEPPHWPAMIWPSGRRLDVPRGTRPIAEPVHDEPVAVVAGATPKALVSALARAVPELRIDLGAVETARRLRREARMEADDEDALMLLGAFD